MTATAVEVTTMTTKSERLQIRITPELKAELQRLAEADGRTVSNYVEQLIKSAVESK